MATSICLDTFPLFRNGSKSIVGISARVDEEEEEVEEEDEGGMMEGDEGWRVEKCSDFMIFVVLVVGKKERLEKLEKLEKETRWVCVMFDE